MKPLKERIMKEMVIKDTKSWNLAKEIYLENETKLKDGVTIEKIYNRILELKREGFE